MTVDVGTQDQGPERSHKEADAESGERKHQGGKLTVLRKKSFADGRGIVAEDHKIVHFEEISAGNADHRLDLCRTLAGFQHGGSIVPSPTLAGFREDHTNTTYMNSGLTAVAGAYLLFN